MAKEKSAKIDICLLVVSVIIQVLIMVWIGSHKGAYHTDEAYSYILSNSYYADRISNADIWERWITGNDMEKFLSVQRGERFAYDRVYYNNSFDAHPPMYYFVLHTVCSFFPDMNSQWLGIGLNIVLFIATQIILYLLAKRVCRHRLWCILPGTIWGGTLIGIDTVLFIRMYMLVTLFSVLLVYLHCQMLMHRTKVLFFLCFLTTFLGVITHYYFAVLAFFLAASFCLYLLFVRKWKDLLCYAGAMLSAIVGMFLFWPAAVHQIMGSSTNNVGNEVSSHFFDFSNLGQEICSFGEQIKHGISFGFHSIKWIILLIFLSTLVLAIFFRNRNIEVLMNNIGDREDTPNVNIWIMVIFFSVLVCSFVSIVHISGKFSFVRYVYHLIPLSVVLGVWLCEAILIRTKMSLSILGLMLLVVSILGNISIGFQSDYSYSLVDKERNFEELAPYCENMPLVLVNNGSTAVPTGNIELFIKCPDIFMSKSDVMVIGHVDEIITEKMNGNGIVFCVLTDQAWHNGYNGDEVMRQIIVNSKLVNTYYEIGVAEFCSVYLVK